MPYTKKICTRCDKKCERYHNVRKCPRCGQLTLIAFTRHTDTSLASMRIENRHLRSEVNSLRLQNGLGVKYVEWEKGPKT